MALIRQTLCSFCRILHSTGATRSLTHVTKIGRLTVPNSTQRISTGLPTPAVHYSSDSGDAKYNNYKKFQTNVQNIHKPSKSAISEGPNKYQPNSPYVQPVPYCYGYTENIHKGGLLPRLNTSMEFPPKEIVDKKWDTKHALFGQNDYIDILGDGDVHPVDLVHGPRYVVGFQGHELQHLLRRMQMQGSKLKKYFPDKYQHMEKRKRFLLKRYNYRRSKRH